MLKPKKRLWQPDGIERLVEVIAPKVEEKTYGNNYDQAEVQRRLSYLANLVDSQGWSIRGVNNPNSSMRADLFNEGQAANDILDENSATAQNINHLINQSDVRRRQEVIQKMQTGQSATPPPTQTPQSDNPTPATTDADGVKLLIEAVNNTSIISEEKRASIKKTIDTILSDEKLSASVIDAAKDQFKNLRNML
jgi:hypothetical protein